MGCEVARAMPTGVRFAERPDALPTPIRLPDGGHAGELQGLRHQRRVSDILVRVPGVLYVRETEKDGEEDASGVDLVAGHESLGTIRVQVKSTDYNERRFYRHTLVAQLTARGLPATAEDVQRYMDEQHLIVVNAGHVKSRRSGSITPVTDAEILERIQTRIDQITVFGRDGSS